MQPAGVVEPKHLGTFDGTEESWEVVKNTCAMVALTIDVLTENE